MSTTPDLGIPYIASQQGQPEATHNDALNRLQMTLFGVIAVGEETPPGDPDEGDAYVLGATPTGDWAGRANAVAAWYGTGWIFLPDVDGDGTPIAIGARHAGLRVWDRDTGQPYVWDGAAWAVEATLAVPPSFAGYIAGLGLANNGTDADHDVDIGPGSARDVADAAFLTLAAALTKQLDAAWSVGDAAGGLDTGSIAGSTLYGVWLIGRSDTGVVDALFSLDASAAGGSVTMPAGYDRKRLIGAVKTDATPAIIAFTQFGDHFRYIGDAVVDLTDATITHQAVEQATLSVPPNCLAHCYLTFENDTATDAIAAAGLRTAGAADALGIPEAAIYINMQGVTTTGAYGAALVQVLVDGARQVDYSAQENSGAVTIDIATLGFHMLTRSNPA